MSRGKGAMALFFDTDWFDARLRDVGLSHADLARAMGLAPESLRAIWKDQRTVTDSEFRLLAMLLGVPEVEVRRRAGIQGAAPGATPPERAQSSAPSALDDPHLAARLRGIEMQLVRLENRMERLMHHLGVPD